MTRLTCPDCGHEFSDKTARRFGPDKHTPGVRTVVETLEDETDDGAPTELVILRLTERGVVNARERVAEAIRRGEIYEPTENRLRVV